MKKKKESSEQLNIVIFLLLVTAALVWTSPGHWSGGYWYPPIYHKPYTWTKYKVKVTLKKKVPKIGGMRIGDTWTKGNKTSYTVWLPKGAQTGKKLNIYMNTGLSKSNGQGPQIKKVIKAK